MKKSVGFVCALLMLAGVSFAVMADECQLPDKEDSYKLAVSWQPAFCESHRGKPECKITDVSVYQASNFTLHGLWPNKKECGTNYGLCGQYKQQVKSFCDYDPVKLSDATLKELGVVMPSVASGSCLDRHEWYKHGTCQTEWDADRYFATAVRLTKEFNGAGIAEFMQKNVGKTVATSEFFAVLNKTFGKNASKRFTLGCDKQGNLVDLFINLPKDIPDNVPLADLIQQAPESYGSRCGKRFTVDAMGFSK